MIDNLGKLKDAGFDIEAVNHALAILTKDFPDQLKDLYKVLSQVRIKDIELIRGGGGESIPTQRMRRALTDLGWRKRNITIRKTVNGIESAARSHEIDHVKRTSKGLIALEIEWNNKDPFFDRDLENFQRLHNEGAISVGIIVTRGKSLQENLYNIISNCAQNHRIQGFDDLSKFNLNPTSRQRKMVKSTGLNFIQDWALKFVQDKFGSATTHWDKLKDRITRGVGNPCPLLLIGIPKSSVEISNEEL